MEQESTIRVGTAGWSYEDWEGIVYPQNKGSGFDPLGYLANYFDTLELNVTFYRPPTQRMAASWVKRVGHNSHFKFTAKLWKGFTHDRGTATVADELSYKRGIEPILDNSRLGTILVQFPWSFKNNRENFEYLEKLLNRFANYPLALEVRHSSWDKEEVYTFLQEKGVGFCNIDQPLISRSIAPTSRITSRIGYIRLHGQNYRDWFRENAGRDERYNYLYSADELKPWIEKIVKIAHKAIDTFVITNNHYRGQAVCNALQIKSLLRSSKVHVPAGMLSAFPQLKDIALEEPQQRLFE
jgi:uncharacterized protein YecE (DUF72 family)